MKTLTSSLVFLVFMITCSYAMAQLQVVVTQNNTSCSVPNGSASASVNGGTVGYTFEWFDIAMNPLGVTGPVANNLAAGNYTVIARVESTGAVVGVSSFLIADQIEILQVSVTSIPNTSCNPALANGALMATVTGTSDYSYKWFEGADPAGSLISTNAQLVGRPAGTYTLEVTDIITTCYARVTAQIIDQIAIPVVSVVATNNTNCTTPNGTLNAVTEQPSFQYVFNWYDAAMNPLGVTGPVANSLAAGNYSVTVTDILTACVATASATIADDCTAASPGFSGVAGNVITNPKKAQGSTISYYPNPVSGTLWVSSAGSAALALIDHSGQTVLQQNVSPGNTPLAIDVSALKPGRYVLRVNEGGVITNYQIVVKK